MLRYSVATIVLLFAATCFSQSTGKILYKDFVYDQVTVTKDISYRRHPQGVKDKYSLLDMYEAKNDSFSLRPLIIWLHGGGFKYGNKKSNGVPIWSKTFAQRGYVCAAINYRLSKKRPLRRFPDLVEGCMDAIADARVVISYFKTNHAIYRIDTTRIILAGNSAGAMIALHSAYSSPYEMERLIKKHGYDTASCAHNPDKIFAVINCWGALFDSSWLSNEKVPIASVFGSKDKIVSPGNKSPLSGSQVIYRYASSLGIAVTIKSFDGYGHELQKHFNPFLAGGRTKKRWLAAGQFAADFLQEILFQQRR